MRTVMLNQQCYGYQCARVMCQLWQALDASANVVGPHSSLGSWCAHFTRGCIVQTGESEAHHSPSSHLVLALPPELSRSACSAMSNSTCLGPQLQTPILSAVSARPYSPKCIRYVNSLRLADAGLGRVRVLPQAHDRSGQGGAEPSSCAHDGMK